MINKMLQPNGRVTLRIFLSIGVLLPLAAYDLPEMLRFLNDVDSDCYIAV